MGQGPALKTGREERSHELLVGLTYESPGSRPDATPRKEVIQPQVPLRLPCYDFTPVTDRSLVASLPRGLR